MLYTYRAVDMNGQAFAGEREAGSERELADALKSEGRLLIEAGPRTRRGWSIPLAIPNLLRRVSLVERMVFARNLAVMIGAGIPLVRALEALERQSASPVFREVIAALRTGVIRGETLAASMRVHEGIFGALFINMIEAGEVSGNLERTLKLLARQMHRDHALRSKVRGAMIYPAIVVLALAGVGVLMLVWVVPTLTETFADLGVELPLTTRIIIGASNFILAYVSYLAVGVAVAIALSIRLVHTARGKRAFDAAVLRAPIFGAIVRKLNAARFARTLSSLIASGVPITRSLEVTARVLGNTNFREVLLEAAGDIQRGQALYRILEVRPDLFPPMVTQMIQVGEESGALTRMLLRLALFYEEEVAAATKDLSSIIEPTLMIAIGGIVGFFAVSMIQPIYGGLGNL